MDDEIEGLKARIAQLEGSPTPVPVYITKPPGHVPWWKVMLWIGTVVVGLFVCLIIYGAMVAPETPQQRAEDFTRQCIADQGDGDWVASSGVTLETHCKLVGSLKALDENRRANPERY